MDFLFFKIAKYLWINIIKEIVAMVWLKLIESFHWSINIFSLLSFWLYQLFFYQMYVVVLFHTTSESVHSLSFHNKTENWGWKTIHAFKGFPFIEKNKQLSIILSFQLLHAPSKTEWFYFTKTEGKWHITNKLFEGGVQIHSIVYLSKCKKSKKITKHLQDSTKHLL